MKNMAFITLSSSFDPLITQFKKSGINASKKDIDSYIENCEILLVDLGYPKEEAYPYLQKIQSLPNYSDKIILAIISHKSQIKKLRSIALGCDGYISPSISYPDLHQKLKELYQPEKYLVSQKYDDKEVTISFEGQLTHISESGCLIKSSLSLNPDNRELSLTSKIIQDLSLSQEIIYRSARSNPLIKRNYQSQINFLNLNENDRLEIRKMIHSWKIT